MPFQIIRNDITKVHADAIVNTANPEPVFAAGTDAAVYRAAGEKKLLAERKKIGRLAPGEAAVTPAFRLHARYIIHTVGPVWIDGEHGELATLASCYRKSLLLANRLGCRSIAFPLISTGVYGFPRDRALEIALAEFSAFLQTESSRRAKEAVQEGEEGEEEAAEMEITLVVFDRSAFDLSAGLVENVRQYIDENYVGEAHAREYGSGDPRRNEGSGFLSESRRIEIRRRRKDAGWFRTEETAGQPGGDKAYREPDLTEEAEEFDLYPGSPSTSFMLREESAPEKASARRAVSGKEPVPVRKEARAGGGRQPKRSLQEVMSRVGESFQECLLRMIDERNLKDSEVYKRANIDRKLFSKIRCNPSYTPGRRTAIALAIALELNLDEMTDLLRKAGIALSPGSKFDLIIRYCVENRIYNIIEINAILFDYDQELLGR